MGSFVTPIAVPLNKVINDIGSKNKKLFATLINDYGHELMELDTMVMDAVDDDVENPLTGEEALRQMIMGEPYNDDLGFVYGYVFEILCLHHGEVLPNSEWSSMHADWIDTVDHELVRLGVPKKTLSVAHLLYSGPPVALPRIDDYPGIGTMTFAEMTAALAELTDERMDNIQQPEVQTSLAELRGWLATCAEQECDLVCIYA